MTRHNLLTDELDRLRHPDEARAIVMSHAPLLEQELVPIADAHWRVLAVDVTSAGDHPPFAASTMDGYAVIAADTSPWREVIGVQTAGSMLDVKVTDGTAIRITTGAPIPSGADAVVKVENTELAEDHVIIHQEEIKKGENIRAVGADIKQGSHVLPAGTVLGPAEIGLLARNRTDAASGSSTSAGERAFDRRRARGARRTDQTWPDLRLEPCQPRHRTGCGGRGRRLVWQSARRSKQH